MVYTVFTFPSCCSVNRTIIIIFQSTDDKKQAASGDSEEEEGDKKERKKGCSDDEVVAVLSHELGHWSLNHVFKNFAFGQVCDVNIFHKYKL